MAGTRWNVQVNEDLNNMEAVSIEMDQWSKSSIYKLPTSLIDTNKKAYTPQIVSFGPYHYDPLSPMEAHKRRTLLHFLKRCGKSVEVLEDALGEVENELKDSYTLLHSLPKEVTDVFLQMMILDGCFMLEIPRTAAHELDNYAPNDPIFSDHSRRHFVPYINRDMLLLENQLPILVLEKLVEIEHDNVQDEGFVTNLIYKFLLTNVSANMGKCVHVLDVYKKGLIQHEPHLKYIHRRTGSRYSRRASIMGPATGLKEAGIRLKPNTYSGFTRLMDITFSRGVLRLPVLVVDDATESVFLNLLTFERCHVGAGNEVTSYISLMANIIDNAKDVELLGSKGIILNAVESDGAAANLFRSLCKDLIVTSESIAAIVNDNICD